MSLSVSELCKFYLNFSVMNDPFLIARVYLLSIFVTWLSITGPVEVPTVLTPGKRLLDFEILVFLLMCFVVAWK